MADSQPPQESAGAHPMRPRTGWLRPGWHLAVGIGVFLLGLYFSLNSAELERQRELSDRRSTIQEDLSNFRARLETEIYASVAMARGLGVNVVVQEGISEAQFETVAQELLRDQENILNLSLAPGFVIRSIYPREGNGPALGLDLLDDPIQKQAVLRAISDDAPVLAGPFERVQGGSALAVRVPLWVNRDGVPRLWGAVSVALDYERLMRSAGVGKLERDLRLSIVGRDASGPGGDLIRGERLADRARAVKTPVLLPGGSWLISAEPIEGWHARPAWQTPGFLLRMTLSLLAGLATARILHDRQRIRRLAGMDSLTNLPNRRWALQQLARMIARGRRGVGGFALLSFDLDGFKPVNDTYGHAAGDLLLAVIGRRLSESVRPGDVVARMGGDEFLVLVPTDPGVDEDWLRAVALRVQAAINRPVPIEGHWVVVGASIGIARFPEDGDQAEVLLRKADEAMYRAKHGRAHGVEFASPMRLGEGLPAGD
jgi:diguanylate cyclase (GGDEF)-like protein